MDWQKIDAQKGLKQCGENNMLEKQIQMTNDLSSQPQDQTHNDFLPSFEQQCSQLTHQCLNQSNAS
jgi:predicted nucleic-acid-binding Zn-ribbon protein